jgi:hemolysin activation/secretion protein
MLPVEENTTLKGLGLQITADRRSSVHYPRSGFFTHLKYFTYPKFFGNKDVSSKIEIDFNQYIPARQNHDVLAGRFFAGIGLGDLTFNQKLIVGRTDIRGYTQGEVRGNYLLDIQGEYRWNILDRFGIVGFLGLATVFKAINEKDDGRLLPGIGAGFRYTVDTETHMNAGMDLAFGIGDWGIYFRIGEAF